MLTLRLRTVAFLLPVSSLFVLSAGPARGQQIALIETRDIILDIKLQPGVIETTEILRFSEPVSLEGVFFVAIDALILERERLSPEEGAYDANYGIFLVDGDSDVVFLQASGFGGGSRHRFGTFRNLGELTSSFSDTIDGVRFVVSAGFRDPDIDGELRARLTGLADGNRAGFRFIREGMAPDGVNQSRVFETDAIVPQMINLEGATEWEGYFFEEPVNAENLRYIFTEGFTWGSNGAPSATTQLRLILGDGRKILPEENDLLLDDAFSLSRDEPGENRINASHSLWIEGAKFGDLEGLQIVGFEWRSLLQGGAEGANVEFASRTRRFRIDFFYVESNAPEFRRGDCNDDGNVDLSDAICVLNWLFLGGAASGCLAASNISADEAINITDPVYLLNHLFLGGPAPAAPIDACGTSELEVDEVLGCDESSCT